MRDQRPCPTSRHRSNTSVLRRFSETIPPTGRYCSRIMPPEARQMLAKWPELQPNGRNQASVIASPSSVVRDRKRKRAGSALVHMAGPAHGQHRYFSNVQSHRRQNRTSSGPPATLHIRSGIRGTSAENHPETRGRTSIGALADCWPDHGAMYNSECGAQFFRSKRIRLPPAQPVSARASPHARHQITCATGSQTARAWQICVRIASATTRVLR